MGLGDEACGFRAFDPGDIVLVFEQDAEGFVNGFGGELVLVEMGEGARPVDGLSDAGEFEEILLAEALDEGDDTGGEGFADAGGLAGQDLAFALCVGVVDPVVETAPADRVVDFAGAVGG